MAQSLTPELTDGILDALGRINRELAARYPGESEARQPVHTVYGGAQIFKADTAAKLGSVALNALKEYAPTAPVFAKALQMPGGAGLHKKVYDRLIGKLRREPIEDFRIDFEDGYGNRPEEEEDRHAESAANEVARGMAESTLPPFIGFRVKPFTEDLKARSIRTLDLFISTLAGKTGGKLPPGFVVTLPKVLAPDHVQALDRLLTALESRLSLSRGTLKIELMIETPQSIFTAQGTIALPSLVAAAGGRCVAAHFGVYDYTASNNITAQFQSMVHPACDFARSVMKVSLAGTGIWLSDGATNIMPVGPHRAAQGKKLTPKQKKENLAAVHRIWKLNFEHINHSLMNGIYQGWDLHPAQLPVRYAAVYAFFQQELATASNRLRIFMEKAAQATLIGDVFDDAATGQGLLNFFLQGIGCGAIEEAEARNTGLSLDEIRSRSFVRILKGRRSGHRAKE